MKPVVTAAEMSRIDTEAQTGYGIPSIVLMEHAGLAMYRELCRELSESGISPHTSRPTLVVVAGRGNNGGDGLVIARLAAIEGRFAVEVLDAGCARAEPESQTGIHLASCRVLGVPVTNNPSEALSKLGKDDWIIDAIAGTGIQGALRGEKAELIASINEAAAKEHVASRAPRVFAVDVPSGLGDEFAVGYPVIRSDVTATVGWHKRFMLTPAGRKWAGSIRVVDIFFPNGPDSPPDFDEPAGTVLLEHKDAARVIPSVPETSHKGDRGHLAIFAGSPGTVGAAMLCGDAAVHARCGLVSLIADPPVAARVEGLNPSVMVHSAESPEAFPDTFTRRLDAALIGPGWGTSAERQSSMIALTRKIHRGVLDADALTILSNTAKRDMAHLSDGAWVATPHPGECARMAGCPVSEVLAEPDRVIAKLASEYGIVVILKAAVSWIAAPDGGLWVFDGTHRAGGVGGAGDVLAGVTGAFMAAGATPLQAAMSGVMTHSRALHSCFSHQGWFSSAELPWHVGKVLAEIEVSNSHG